MDLKLNLKEHKLNISADKDYIYNTLFVDETEYQEFKEKISYKEFQDYLKAFNIEYEEKFTYKNHLNLNNYYTIDFKKKIWFNYIGSDNIAYNQQLINLTLEMMFLFSNKITIEETKFKIK